MTPIGRTGAAGAQPTQVGPNGYTVKRGDTLGNIAHQLGVTTHELIAANPQLPTLATNPDKIKPGWELKIPVHQMQGRVTTETSGWRVPLGAEQRERVTGSQVRPNDVGNKLLAGGAQALDRNTKGHEKAIDETGVGLFYGDHSSFKSKTLEEKKQWVKENAKPGTHPAMPKESSCIGWAMDNVGAAYRAAGKGDRWNEIMSTVVAKGSKGTDLAKELKKDGWEAVYWNPDAKHPPDGLAEHSFSAAQVAKGKPYYGIEIDHVVENYRPTAGQGTKQDLSGYNKLEKIPFFFGLAKGGVHTFAGRDGKVNEFHWSEEPNSKHAIQETPLKDWGWNSGVIMVPPGSWPKDQ